VNDEAHRFGLVLSSSTAKVAADAHDNLERLKLVFQGLGYSLMGATLPAISNLVDRLIDVATNANIPQLAASFGTAVTTAVNATADALKFAATHAHALKIALEAIAALQLAKIAIPLLADLANGGLEKAAAGVGKFLIGFAGLGRVIPALTQFTGWLATSVWFIGQLAAEEGIAAAAGYVLSGAVAALGGPVGIAVAAIAGIAIMLSLQISRRHVLSQGLDLRTARCLERRVDSHGQGPDVDRDTVQHPDRLHAEAVGWVLVLVLLVHNRRDVQDVLQRGARLGQRSSGKADARLGCISPGRSEAPARIRVQTG
jgi:hypothetical protein